MRRSSQHLLLGFAITTGLLFGSSSFGFAGQSDAVRGKLASLRQGNRNFKNFNLVAAKAVEEEEAEELIISSTGGRSFQRRGQDNYLGEDGDQPRRSVSQEAFRSADAAAELLRAREEEMLQFEDRATSDIGTARTNNSQLQVFLGAAVLAFSIFVIGYLNNTMEENRANSIGYTSYAEYCGTAAFQIKEFFFPGSECIKREFRAQPVAVPTKEEAIAESKAARRMRAFELIEADRLKREAEQDSLEDVKTLAEEQAEQAELAKTQRAKAMAAMVQKAEQAELAEAQNTEQAELAKAQ